MTTIDEYIGRFPESTKAQLRNVRRTIAEAAPEATETISYGIPTFDPRGTHLVHFAGYEGHVSFYPTSGGIAAFRVEIGSYSSSKGTVRFPLDQPVPLELIRRITEFRVREVTGVG